MVPYGDARVNLPIAFGQISDLADVGRFIDPLIANYIPLGRRLINFSLYGTSLPNYNIYISFVEALRHISNNDFNFMLFYGYSSGASLIRFLFTSNAANIVTIVSPLHAFTHTQSFMLYIHGTDRGHVYYPLISRLLTNNYLIPNGDYRLAINHDQFVTMFEVMANDRRFVNTDHNTFFSLFFEYLPNDPSSVVVLFETFHSFGGF